MADRSALATLLVAAVTVGGCCIGPSGAGERIGVQRATEERNATPVPASQFEPCDDCDHYAIGIRHGEPESGHAAVLADRSASEPPPAGARMATPLAPVEKMHPDVRAAVTTDLVPHPGLDWAGALRRRDAAEALDVEAGPLDRARPRLAAQRPVTTVIVTFVEDLELPRFPEIPIDQDVRSGAAAQSQAQEVIRSIRSLRVEGEQILAPDLQDLEAKVVGRHWIARVLYIEIPESNLLELASHDDVLFIDPEFGGPPPSAPSSSRSVSSGFEAIGLTAPVPYRGGGAIALLDTGVNQEHPLLWPAADRILKAYVCPDDDGCDIVAGSNDDSLNHGTASASILIGSDGNAGGFRGGTEYPVHSYRVYPNVRGSRRVSIAGAVSAIEQSRANLDAVILAEIQNRDFGFGAVSRAADGAFKTGAVVVAANGNDGPAPKTVAGPAAAHGAIGVGAFDVATSKQWEKQSIGPTRLDKRFKPDIQAPTDTMAASISGSKTMQYGGTSGAAPYGAVAAVKIRDTMNVALKALRESSSSDTSVSAAEPGHVYAGLILAGSNPQSSFSDSAGAGPVQLPSDGMLYWGHVDVGRRASQVVPMPSRDHRATVVAALWWPEGLLEAHANVDLEIVNGSGNRVAVSKAKSSVFERASAKDLAPGSWSLRIHRDKPLPLRTQRVYFAAFVE